jgi:hypothetical protein
MRLCGASSGYREQRLERAVRLGLRPESRQPQHAQHLVELRELAHRGRLVHAPQHARTAHRGRLADAAVREQHELLDQLVALEVRPPHEPERVAGVVHLGLDLDGLDLQRAHLHASARAVRAPAA